MGIALWTAGGVLALVAARLIPHARPDGFVVEALVAIIGAISLGLVATWLDFGGWREMDWRAAVFAACGAMALVGLVRLGGLARRYNRI